MKNRLLPFLAVLRYDLRTLWSGWLVRLWLAGSALLTLILLMFGWATLPSSYFVSMILSPYIVVPWFLAVMVLGVDPVSGSRIEALADGILSRPVTRYEYLFAAWSARVLTVLGVYLVVVVPAILLVAFAKREVPLKDQDIALFGTIAALSVTGLILTLQVSLGFFLGTLLRRPLVAILVLLFLWYPVNMILHTFSLEEFSPISLSQAMPKIAKTKFWTDEKDKAKTDRQLELAAEQLQASLSSFFGGAAPPAPKKDRGFFEEGEGKYEDLALWRVLLGYATPTLVSVAAATWIFCRRDL